MNCCDRSPQRHLSYQWGDSKMNYADLTTRDRNPVKRWIQKRRFSDALAVLNRKQCEQGLRVLDLGAGNGELVRRLAGLGDLKATVYEPTPSLMAQARKKLSALHTVEFWPSLDGAGPETFDYVFCLEVLEHLPRPEIRAALKAMERLLKPHGKAVIGVPHELHLPALLKGIFRLQRRYGKYDARPGNIIKAVAGRPPAPRPLIEITPGFAYHPFHLGSDHRALQSLLQEHFSLLRRWFSPFARLGPFLNSEVYFLLQKNP